MFKDLQEDLLKILSEDRHDGIYSIDQRSSHNQGFSDNKDLINTALRNAKFQLGPAFLGALKLLYQPHCPQSDWIPILESGLTLLKTYVDQWKDFFKRNRSPTWFSKQEQSILQIDWSNMGDVLNYMGKRKSADAMPTQPLKYLLDLWYKDFMSGQVGTRSVRHRITPPNLSLIEESYISHSVKTRKPGSVNLWNIENDLGRVCRKKRRSSSRQQENVLVAAFRGEEDIRGHGAIRQNEDIRGDDTIQDSQETRGDDITWPDEHINTDGNVVSTSKIPIGDVSLLNSGWNFDGDENVSSNTILDRMKADSALWSDYSSFFETFEREVKVHYEGKSVEPQHTSLRGLYSLTLGETEALNVINVAKNQITTSFMFILSQARSGQKSKEPLENILQSGWNHLKAYFETWEHYILSKEAPIDFPGRRKTVNRIDWSNIPETLRYMATHNQQSTGASHILSHLIDRSYSDVVDLQGNKVKSLAYQLSRPSEKLIQDALSRYKSEAHSSFG
ncbi:hypothetical protein DFH28DRAFT_898993 [Melampsora americana]|nr:hypothetical protein DFH28DRAFT_898993 [Melampsora americana]